MSVGDCVSVDVFVSSTTRLIVHMYGFITHQPYHYACVFVEHHYDFTYKHILNHLTGDVIVESREAFKEYAEPHSFDIKIIMMTMKF